MGGSFGQGYFIVPCVPAHLQNDSPMGACGAYKSLYVYFRPAAAPFTGETIMDKKMLLLVNARAGKGQVKNNLLEVIDIFVKNGWEVTVHTTQKSLDAQQAAQDRAGDYSLAVCCGGDGTLSEMVEGLMHVQPRPLAGYIPAGTTNDFASSLHLSKNMARAAKSIVTGTPFPCDVGSFNDRFFTYIAAFGAFTDVAYSTPQQSKSIFGHLAYVFEGMKRLYQIKTYHLTIQHDGETLEGDFMYGMITNSTSIAGVKEYKKKKVLLDDGLFEVFLIKATRNPIEVHNIITALLKQNIHPQYMYFFRTAKLHITSDKEIPWTLDGEYGGSPLEVDIENKKHAVSFLLKQ